MPREPIDQTRAPVLAVAGATVEHILTAEELHDWATERAKKCGHVRDFSVSCRVCQGTTMAINLLDGGAPCVRVVPYR